MDEVREDQGAAAQEDRDAVARSGSHRWPNGDQTTSVNTAEQDRVLVVTEDARSFFAPSNVISVISLLVAAMSVVFSLQQSGRAEVSQQREELLEYVGKISALTADDSGKNNTFEIAALSSQAAAILAKVPDVPATVYSQVAEGLVNTDHFEDAEELLGEALARSTADGDIQQQIYVHRLLARIRYSDRDAPGMREERRRSVALSQNYDGDHETTLKYTYAGYSLLFWAQDEANLGNCGLADEHVSTAVESARFADNDSLNRYIDEARKVVESCRNESLARRPQLHLPER